MLIAKPLLQPILTYCNIIYWRPWEYISVKSSKYHFPRLLGNFTKWLPFCLGAKILMSSGNETGVFWDNLIGYYWCVCVCLYIHDDVIKWKHFPCYWPFVLWIHRSPVNSPHKGLWCGALMFSLICAWTNGGVNNREAGDLRRHRAHYDVTVMC